MLAAYVGRATTKCWDFWQRWEHAERAWAIGVLRNWKGHPEWMDDDKYS